MLTLTSLFSVVATAGDPSSLLQGGAPAQLRALRAQGRRTVGRLLDAALEVFDERGYQAARVDDVVKRARTSHGTFYLYFANKDDLFRVLAQECAAAMDELADDFGPISPGGDGARALRDWVTRFATTYRRFGPVIRAWAETPVGADLGALGMDTMDRLGDRVAAAVTAANPDIDAACAAIALLAMMERLNYYVVSRRIEVDDDRLLDTLTAILHVGVFDGRR